MLPSKKLDIVEPVLFLSSFVFFYFYIISYGLVLDSDEIANIGFVYRLIEEGALTKSFIKPLPLLLAFSTYYLSPYVYELITAIFTSLLLLFIYKLCAIFFNRKVGLLASILVFINPETFILTLGGNSVIIQASLVFISYYFLISARAPTDKRFALSYLFLFLACLTRPEPWIFLPVVIYYTLIAKRSGARRNLIWPLSLLIIVPLVWILKDYIVTGDPLWTARSVKQYAETTEFYKSTSLAAFPAMFIGLMHGIFISIFFISVALLGFFLDIKRAQNSSILSLSLLLLFILYWILAGRGFVIVPRFLYFHYLIIAIYFSVGIYYLIEKLPLRSEYFRILLVALVASFLVFYMETQKIRDSRSIMRLTSAINRDIILSTNILKKELRKDEASSILLSSRRIPLMDLEMRDYANIHLMSYTQFYSRKETVEGRDVNWIIYDVRDLYPNSPTHEYFRNLLASEKDLLSEGIKLDRIYRISQSMLLLKIGYQ